MGDAETAFIIGKHIRCRLDSAAFGLGAREIPGAFQALLKDQAMNITHYSSMDEQTALTQGGLYRRRLIEEVLY